MSAAKDNSMKRKKGGSKCKKGKKNDTLDEKEGNTAAGRSSASTSQKSLKSGAMMKPTKKSSLTGGTGSQKGIKNRFDPKISMAIKTFHENTMKICKAGGDLAKFFDANLKQYSSKEGFQGWQDNMAKNRSKQIPCLDKTRVPIEEGYINANMVVFDEFERQYILTQYPMKETMEDFWNMVFQNAVETVIAIFNPDGDAEIKEYKDKSKSLQGNTLTQRETAFKMSQKHKAIAQKSVRRTMNQMTSYFPYAEGQFMTIGQYFVHTRKVEKDEKPDRPIIYTVEILPEGCSESRFVRVVNYPKWGKTLLPPTTKTVLSLIRSISLDPLQKGPVVVHCDYGVNRSATVVFTDLISQKILNGQDVDVEDLFKKFRNQRAGVFTSADYFVYSVYAAVQYIHLRCKARGCANKDAKKCIKKLLVEIAKCCKSEPADCSG